MKTINIDGPVRQLMVSAFKKQTPRESDVENIISGSARVFVNGELVLIYEKVNHDFSEIRHACINLEFQSYTRHSGLNTQTLNINASPRSGMRTNKCVFTRFRRVQPKTHQIFLKYARKIAKTYRENFRKAYVNQIKRSYIGKSRVDNAYRIQGTPFTSGVINKDSALGYHQDIANTKDGISCMLILKKGVAGGELILPELKIGFACEDGYILLFDGQKYIHGVTPIIKPQNGTGYRYTIVYYNNKGMSLCLPPDEEERYYKEYLEKKTELKYQQQKQSYER